MKMKIDHTITNFEKKIILSYIDWLIIIIRILSERKNLAKE